VKFDEGAVERAMIVWLREVGWAHLHGTEIAPDGSRPERSTYADTVLVGRLREAIKRLNPLLPPRRTTWPFGRRSGPLARQS